MNCLYITLFFNIVAGIVQTYKDTKVLNMYNIFNLQKEHCEWIACT